MTKPSRFALLSIAPAGMFMLRAISSSPRADAQAVWISAQVDFEIVLLMPRTT